MTNTLENRILGLKSRIKELGKRTKSAFAYLGSQFDQLNKDIREANDFVRRIKEIKDIESTYTSNSEYIKKDNKLKSNQKDFKFIKETQLENILSARERINQIRDKEYLNNSQKIVLERTIQSVYEPMLSDFEKVFGESTEKHKVPYKVHKEKESYDNHL